VGGNAGQSHKVFSITYNRMPNSLSNQSEMYGQKYYMSQRDSSYIIILYTEMCSKIVCRVRLQGKYKSDKRSNTKAKKAFKWDKNHGNV
jgi:hypothetical protein